MDENHVYPNAWRFRDYVVKAFNDDMPFDRFIREQIAGDLLLPPNPVATGFLALGPKPSPQWQLLQSVPGVQETLWSELLQRSHVVRSDKTAECEIRMNGAGFEPLGYESF